LLEQAAGQVLDARTFSQARAVQQPLGYTHGNALGRGNTGGYGGNRI
jgi:hypothetical protein